MNPKRIAILAPSPPRATLGGIERVVINIANGLAGRGHEVDFLTSHTRSNMWDTLSSNVRKRVVGPKSPYLPVRSTRLRTEQESARPDVFNT